MNVKVPNKFVLFESQNKQQQDVNKQVPNDSEFEKVLKNKSFQFIFDSGLFMAKMSVKLNSKFGLKWHFDNSTNQDEFINSIALFIGISGSELTENDKNRLVKQYEIQSKSK